MIKWQANANTTTAHFDDETVVLNFSNASYYGLKGAAVFAWEKLAQPHTLGELTEAIAGAFEVEPERVRGDLEGLIEELRQRELIVAVES